MKYVFFVALLVGCSGTDDDLEFDAGADATPDGQHCVWNQAYQENYAADTVDAILDGAHDCYVLVDPFLSADVRDAIPQMVAQGNTVGCYFSSGTCEDWRDDWEASKNSCVEDEWGQWPGEYFVNTADAAIVAVMKARIDTMAEWGCTLVEFDNMDWAFDEDLRATYGFEATEAEAKAYTQTLCTHARTQGVGCMAKNMREGAEGFDGVTFESYTTEKDWWDADELVAFLAEGKLGVIVHYNESNCAQVRADYMAKYGADLSFICEDSALEAYKH